VDQRRFYESTAGGACRSAPAALRNREPIAEVLDGWLPQRGLVLEIASGTGEHAVHFARRFPRLDWQPSDLDETALASIDAWRRESGLGNLRAPIRIDAASSDWPIEGADAVLSINMVHISPWASALGLLQGAARLLAAGAPLILYGPWLEEGVEPAASNLAFDADLKQRNSEWGLRTVESFAAAARDAGFDLEERRPTPANNMILLFRSIR
jgi:SAM-dependent methyltransferase